MNCRLNKMLFYRSFFDWLEKHPTHELCSNRMCSAETIDVPHSRTGSITILQAENQQSILQIEFTGQICVCERICKLSNQATKPCALLHSTHELSISRKYQNGPTSASIHCMAFKPWVYVCSPLYLVNLPLR